MDKHTPGPWVLEAGRNIKTSSGTFYISYGREERTGRPYFSDFCELDANAALIAAAPDMLDALKQIIEDIEDRGITQASINKARAAIGRATGKE